ncbi:MAG TPA: hypothetical protein VK545_21370 [Streptomyces sp.]|nr:hypothetical protein [Streptomyces sp.]
MAEDGTAPILWTVTKPTRRDIFEAAPFQKRLEEQGFGDFLSMDAGTYTWPEAADGSGERLNWLRLPVLDFGWAPRTKLPTKGGFIQEVTGWKPSPLQPVFYAEQAARAAGLTS